MKFINSNIETTKIQPVESPTNRIICIDCSGSMSSELAKLRLHLKNKLPTMVQPQDTLSIIWFSGRSQCGVLFEGIKIDTMQDLSKVNTAIDRFLVPTGMTSFKEPLEEVLAMTERLSGDCTLSFMTDGYNNSSSTSDVIKACTGLIDKLASITFVEYGYYADHSMIMTMAEEVGGSVVLSENFSKYSESLESSMQSNVSGKKIKLTKISADFVVGNLPDGFVIAKPDAVGTVTLPANTTSYSYLTGSGDFEPLGEADLKSAAYGVSALIMRGMADTAVLLASAIGDATLYKKVENSFSKQDYVNVVELANSIGSGKTPLWSEGARNTNMIPDENAYNVLTLLLDLSSQEGNYLHLSHPEFKYNSIGGKRDTASVNGEFIPVFKDKDGEVKAEITTLKFDEDRPNISMLVRRVGTVSLPKNDFGFGESIDSYIWRNYAVVKDGIVNVEKLPVSLTSATHAKLLAAGVIAEPFKVNQTYVIDTTKLPVINRAMTKPSTALELFIKSFELYVLRARQKVLNSMIEKPVVGAGFVGKYSEDGAMFLKSFGVSDGGFSPKTEKSESIDPYMSKVLEVKLAGLSAIPKVETYPKGKNLTASQQVMATQMESVSGLSEDDLKTSQLLTKEAVKMAVASIVETKFGIILGKRWFTDLSGMDDDTREVDFGLGKFIKCQVVLGDKEVG